MSSGSSDTHTPIFDAETDPAFPTLSQELLDELAGFGETRTVDPGVALFHAGDPTDEFFVLLEGRIDVARDDASNDVVVSYRDGQFIGEMRLLTGQRVFLTARTTAVIPAYRTDDGGRTWIAFTPTIVQSTLDYGFVAGTLEAVGGIAPGTPRPLSGSITLRDADGTAFTGTAGPNGAFSIRVPAGSYTITGRSPLYAGGNADCQSIEPVTVAAGATVGVAVDCDEK